jgi:hypothetical protein
MVDIISDKVPGWYGGTLDVTVTFPGNVRKALVTRGEVAPVLSEIIAYDKDPTTQAPRPFLAVTQDGRGNVVYDGGFPKYYNDNVVGTPTTFAQLSGSCKFFHNALKFCANPIKVAQGNNKVLIVGNTLATESFNHKFSVVNNIGPSALQAHGMADAWLPAAQIAGFVVTQKDASDFPGGIVDLTFAMLDQYCMVVFLASVNLAQGTTRLTPSTPTELATYRASGNGIFLITDHCGDVYTSAADAFARRSVFAADAIYIAAQYGTYFSGNYDRTNVRVGDIRAENGDHPLFANIGDNEELIGMVSESIVYVDDHAADEVSPLAPITYNLTTPGVNRINAMVQLNDGTIISRPMRFDLINVSDIKIRDSRVRNLNAGITTSKRAFDLSLAYPIASPPTLTGNVRSNGVFQGTFSISAGVMTYVPRTGNNSTFALNNTDIVTFEILLPFIYNVNITITTANMSTLVAGWKSPAQFSGELIKTFDYNGMSRMDGLKMHWEFANKHFRNKPYTLGNAWGYWPRILPRMLRTLSGVLSSIDVWIVTNAAQWATTKPANPFIGQTCIVANDNSLYTWWDRDNNGLVAWYPNAGASDNAAAVFQVGRTAYNLRDGLPWVINSTNTVLAP